MATLDNFAVVTGTWTPGGAYGVEETGNVGDGYATYNAVFPSGVLRAIQATVRAVTQAASPMAGLAFFDASGPYGAGGLGVGLNIGVGVSWDRYGVGGGVLAATVLADTDYVLQVIETSRQLDFAVFLDGVYLGSIPTVGTTVNAGTVGLYSRHDTSAWWRDVSVWSQTPVPLV